MWYSERMARYRKGYTPWNKGIKWSPKLRKIMLKAHRTFEYRKKMSEMRTGVGNPMFGVRGEESPFWKGDGVSYSGLHKWIAKELGRPPACSRCGRKTVHIDWANKTGEYLRNISDWVAVCRKCHRIHDRNLPVGKSILRKKHG